jgi:phospholipid/cholesterol/gamma-HCH transport system permease protein
MLVALPLLVILSMVTGAIGGMVLCLIFINLSVTEFFNAFQNALSPSTFWVGISKAPFFALIIAIVGCYRGMQVRGSAESVGKMTTQSVVESIFLVIICDGLMSIYFSILDL